MKDDTWWLHLYVMFSRATRMDPTSGAIIVRPTSPPASPARAPEDRAARVAAARARAKARRDRYGPLAACNPDEHKTELDEHRSAGVYYWTPGAEPPSDPGE